ncbi:hypothetical protein B5F86_12410 [Lachnoclostridium sp. An298]|nr:hypothetical protein B5F86_12410 [Lachnoclostridium sp. An298]
MSKILMYYHSGAKNHGCEAIVRSTAAILKKDLILYSTKKSEDCIYGLDKVVNVKEDIAKPLKKRSLAYFYAALEHKIRKDDYKYTVLTHKDFFDQIGKGDICLSIGGDNYCYKGRDILGYYNKEIHRRGGKTVLWGCSFEPSDMTKKIGEDLSKYDLIVSREGISYSILKKVNSNTILLPDPAFQLEYEILPFPEGVRQGNIVGINLSPLVTQYGNKGLIIDNYKNLIEYILKSTDYQIVLIPHVVKDYDDDRVILRDIYNSYRGVNRVFLLDDYNCMQLKGFIARCRFFIGARTHATIAAYSTCVPTLVTGYSVKAKGIARELFGTDKDYVVSVQDFGTKEDLKIAFQWLQNRENEIKNLLAGKMPEYRSRILKAKEYIERL